MGGSASPSARNAEVRPFRNSLCVCRYRTSMRESREVGGGDELDGGTVCMQTLLPSAVFVSSLNVGFQRSLGPPRYAFALAVVFCETKSSDISRIWYHRSLCLLCTIPPPRGGIFLLCLPRCLHDKRVAQLNSREHDPELSALPVLGAKLRFIFG